MNDDDEWKRLRAGEPAAFEQVVRQHYQSVYRQLCYLTGNNDRAADLTQETFLQAWKSVRSFANRASIRTWLHTIATRVWWRERQTADLPIMEIPDSLVSPEAEPLTVALNTAEGVAVACAVRRLPDLYRAVIVLHYVQEMTQPEIADALQIPVGTVKSRLHEAMRRLRRMLPDHSPLENKENQDV